jgi:hypothetical protein
MEQIGARAEPRALGRNPIGIGMKTCEMGQESQPQTS